MTSQEERYRVGLERALAIIDRGDTDDECDLSALLDEVRVPIVEALGVK